MLSKIRGLLLLTYQVILNSSSDINEYVNAVESYAVTGNRPATLPEGYTRFPEDHAAYKIYEINSTWYEGRDRCIEDGAHLAIPDSVEKVKHINSLKTQETKDKNKWLHVGIVKSTTNNEQWVRIDNNLTVTPIPWREGSPNDVGNCSGIAVELDALTDYNCEWGDEYFVCEIPL